MKKIFSLFGCLLFISGNAAAAITSGAGVSPFDVLANDSTTASYNTVEAKALITSALSVCRENPTHPDCAMPVPGFNEQDGKLHFPLVRALGQCYRLSMDLVSPAAYAFQLNPGSVVVLADCKIMP